jgi:hypothetical protein
MARSKRPEKRRPKETDRKEDAAQEAAKDKRQAAKKSGTPAPGTVTESLKAMSHQTDDQAMRAAPGLYPAEPANAEAVYTTGPGQAVEYNYVRQGTYAEDYANQQTVRVQGDTPTGNGAAGFTPGAANNPT